MGDDKVLRGFELVQGESKGKVLKRKYIQITLTVFISVMLFAV